MKNQEQTREPYAMIRIIKVRDKEGNTYAPEVIDDISKLKQHPVLEGAEAILTLKNVYLTPNEITEINRLTCDVSSFRVKEKISESELIEKIKQIAK